MSPDITPNTTGSSSQQGIDARESERSGTRGDTASTLAQRTRRRQVCNENGSEINITPSLTVPSCIAPVHRYALIAGSRWVSPTREGSREPALLRGLGTQAQKNECGRGGPSF